MVKFCPGDRPSVELLVGVTGEKMHPALFYYEGTSFTKVRTKAIGLGILLAQDLLNRYSHRAVLNVNQAASLGTYILSKVKKGVVGCGGPTHIVGLRRGMDFALTEGKDIELIEKDFLKFEDETNKRFIDDLKAKPLPLSWHSEHSKKAPKL